MTRVDRSPAKPLDASTLSRAKTGFLLLSPAQHRVLRCAIEGLTSVETAERLGVSFKTVETQINHVYKKTGARGRVQLAYLFGRLEIDAEVADYLAALTPNQAVENNGE